MISTKLFQTKIQGVLIRSLMPYEDERGSLIELFREDEFLEQFKPAMGYISTTFPDVIRGPHEHHYQTDLFAFLSGQFELNLWENRPGLTQIHETHFLGEKHPAIVLIPPGVVHAYKNISDQHAFVLNFPDQLYAGYKRSGPVDEIRYEDASHPRFKG